MTHEIPKLLIDRGTLHNDGRYVGKADIMPLAYGRKELPLGKHKLWLFTLSGYNADFSNGFDEPFLCMTPDGLIHLMPNGLNSYELSEATSADLQAHLNRRYKHYPSLTPPTLADVEAQIARNFAGWCTDPLVTGWKAPTTLRLLDDTVELKIPPYHEERTISLRSTNASDAEIEAGGFHWVNSTDVQDTLSTDDYVLTPTLTLWKYRSKHTAEGMHYWYQNCGSFPHLASVAKL